MEPVNRDVYVRSGGGEWSMKMNLRENPQVAMKETVRSQEETNDSGAFMNEEQ